MDLPHCGLYDLLFSSHQTKLFCSRHCFASASSAKCPCHLGSQAYFPISIFWEVKINTVLPGSHFCRDVPDLSHEKFLRLQVFLRSPSSSSGHCGKSRKRSPVDRLLSVF